MRFTFKSEKKCKIIFKLKECKGKIHIKQFTNKTKEKEKSKRTQIDIYLHFLKIIVIPFPLLFIVLVHWLGKERTL